MSRGWTGIVKVQRPLVGDLSSVLIYSEHGEIEVLMPLEASEQKKLFGKKLKIYCNAHTEGTHLFLDEPTDEQEW